MNRTLIFSLAGIAVAAGLAVALTPQTGKAGRIKSAPSVEDNIAREVRDRLIPRFNSLVDNRFGMSRLATSDAHRMTRIGIPPKTAKSEVVRYQFTVENSADKDLIKLVKDSNKQVVFYTIGLGHPGRFRGPAYMLQSVAVAPTGSELATEIKAISKNPVEKEQAFTRSGWTFYINPVRSVSERCSNCHAKMIGGPKTSIGDTLGVLVVGVKS